jgi:Ca-activated chloride channel family protein
MLGRVLKPKSESTLRLDSLQLDRELLLLLPPHLAQRYGCVPLDQRDNILVLGMVDPSNQMAIDDVGLITGFDIEPVAIEGDVSSLDWPEWGGDYRPQQASHDCVLTMTGLAVSAEIVGPLAHVKVRQTFHNPLDETLEAIYIFPLSPRAALNQFRLQVGDRVIEGQIQERLQARKTYQEGKQAGHRSALLEQQRDNVFTATIGNVPAGETLSLELCYAERLEMDESNTLFRFPLVVGPRYIPGEALNHSQGLGTAPDTTRVADASNITPPLLPPGLRAPGALSIEVDIDHGGVHLCQLTSTQHAVSAEMDGQRTRISLARQDEALDRDFVLRFRLGRDASNLLMSSGEYFLMTLTPPAEAPGLAPPRDVVFLLDRSGSMGGAKMESARRAVQDFLAYLGPQDRFALMAFDHDMEPFEEGRLCPMSEISRALGWLQAVDARGGTEILAPIQWLLHMSQGDSERFLCAVLVTDGQVGNEPEIYRVLQAHRGPVRIFSLGVDEAVNEAFLRQVARIGRGTCELVAAGEPLEGALNRLAREVGCPLVTDLEIVDAGLHPEEVLPSRLPDLYAARPVSVLGRHRGNGDLLVRGRRQGQPWMARLTPQRCHNVALPLLWAREKIVDLQDRLSLGDALEAVEVQRQVTELGLRYRLVSEHTSFVLVDRDEVIQAQGPGKTVVQPVARPSGWVDVDCTMKDISAQDFGPMDFEEDEEIILLDKLRESVDEAPIVRVVNLILSQAVNDGASQIQILCEPKVGRVLYFIEGQWHDVMSPPRHIMAPLVARVKQLAKLDLGLREMEQVGFVELTHGGKVFQVRITTRPAAQGEGLWLVLGQGRIPTLADLGLDPVRAEQVVQALRQPRGVLQINCSWKLFAAILQVEAQSRGVAVWHARMRPEIVGVELWGQQSQSQLVGFSDVGDNHWELVRQCAAGQPVLLLHAGPAPLIPELGYLDLDGPGRGEGYAERLTEPAIP